MKMSLYGLVVRAVPLRQLFPGRESQIEGAQLSGNTKNRDTQEFQFVSRQTDTYIKSIASKFIDSMWYLCYLSISNDKFILLSFLKRTNKSFKTKPDLKFDVLDVICPA